MKKLGRWTFTGKIIQILSSPEREALRSQKNLEERHGKWSFALTSLNDDGIQGCITIGQFKTGVIRFTANPIILLSSITNSNDCNVKQLIKN